MSSLKKLFDLKDILDAFLLYTHMFSNMKILQRYLQRSGQWLCRQQELNQTAEEKELKWFPQEFHFEGECLKLVKRVYRQQD